MKISELADEFLKNYCERRLRPSTVRGYRVNLYRHMLPVLGDIESHELTVEDIDSLTDLLRNRNLSNRSIVYIHATVRRMLNYAMRRGYLMANPYGRFDMPRIPKYRYRVMNEDEIHRMLDLIKGTILEIPVTMALCYGLRRGEVLGLIPSLDVDKCSDVLHIQRTRTVEYRGNIITPCKTEDSNRYILLRPRHTQMLLGADALLADLTPNQLEHYFKQFLSKNGFPSIRFHDLRHSFATFMLSKGVDLKIISDVLGHADIAITADTYLHPDVSIQRRCLDVLK